MGKRNNEMKFQSYAFFLQTQNRSKKSVPGTTRGELEKTARALATSERVNGLSPPSRHQVEAGESQASIPQSQQAIGVPVMSLSSARTGAARDVEDVREESDDAPFWAVEQASIRSRKYRCSDRSAYGYPAEEYM
jgi:hypothetical protein